MVTKLLHARTDPYAFRFMPRYPKAQYPLFHEALRQVIRILAVYPGAGALWGWLGMDEGD